MDFWAQNPRDPGSYLHSGTPSLVSGFNKVHRLHGHIGETESPGARGNGAMINPGGWRDSPGLKTLFLQAAEPGSTPGTSLGPPRPARSAHTLIRALLNHFILFLLFWGHSRLCSGLTPGSALKDHSGRGWHRQCHRMNVGWLHIRTVP